MQIRTVLERELRVQARRRGTYWFRVLAGGTAAVALGLFLSAQRHGIASGPASRGPWLFALLHTLISVVLAVASPLLSADTLARERREGTLGLLLLTPLTPRTIVLGKITAHLLRAFALWLAAAPVLMVPMLTGGLSLVDVVFALGLEAGVVLGGLAAGLLASSFAERWESAMGLAVLFAVLIGECLCVCSFLGFLPFYWPNNRRHPAEILLILATIMPWLAGSGLIENGFSAMLARSALWMRHGIVAGLTVVLPASALMFALAVGIAARRIRSLGQIPEASTLLRSARGFWLQPLRRRRIGLPRNPVIWLQTRHSSHRLWCWIWTGGIILLWGGLLMAGFRDLQWLALAIPLVLVLGLAFVASTMFQREFETGALELLLVTPLRSTWILRGLLRGLWTSSLPPLVLATAISLFWMPKWDRDFDAHLGVLIVCWSSFFAAPLVAARFGVRKINPFLAWLWTLGFAGLLPLVFALIWAFVTAATADGYDGAFWLRYAGAFAVLQGVIGTVCAWITSRELATRQFQLRPFQRVPG